MGKTREESEVRNLDELFERYRQAPESYAFVPLADACRKMGRIDEALEICENGVRRHVSYPSGHVVKGKCLFDKGDRAAARDAFERVLLLDENNLVALKYLGMIEADEGNLAIAERHFRQILSLDPENREIKTILRMVEEQEPPEQLSAEATPDVMESVNEILGAQESQEDVVALEVEPGDEEAGEVDTSVTSYRVVRSGDELELSDELASVTLAEIFASQGYNAKAEKIYREVLRRQPGSEEVRRRLEALATVKGTLDIESHEPGDSRARDDRPEEKEGSPVDQNPTLAGQGPGDPGVAPANADGGSSTPGSAPEGQDTRGKTTSDGGRPAIDEKDSLVHFRRWLTRMQK
jgi:tetratricopeptide (TPR) repeat protein